ncbi:MAG: outer membrane protein assembly factor BamD [Chthoniobacter sp.]|jgi:outer membrane protein assembly factor BamD|nr:outer membrane protein assembly factor BamD [Chthoniobacter sp.]
MRKTFAALLLTACVASAPRAGAVVVYRADEGWSTQSSSEEDAVEKTASAQLHKAEEAEAAGDNKHALGAYRGLLRKFPTSGVASKSQLKIGELAEKLGDYDHAYDAYHAYITKYPKGEDFDKAVEAEFNIGRRFLEGERKRVFGVKTFASMARAQQIFESIVRDAPFSKYAALAQFYVGQSLEKQEKTLEAIAAYQVVLAKYPGDPVAADAQYQIGYVYFSQARSAYDKAAANKARESFEDFIAHYPSSEKAPQAKENLKSLETRDTSGAINIARFYDKQKNYRAAVIYYQDVIKQQPGSADADAAKKRVDELKSLVGEDALRAGPEKTETGARAQSRRKLQAQVDTAARPDYLGPPVVVPDEVAPAKPRMRTSPESVGPVPAVEPALPDQ